MTAARLLAAAGGVVAALALVGCQEVAPSAAAPVAAPATVEQVSDGVVRVRLTPEGADRVGLQTAQARAAGAGTVVPYAALIYDGTGAPWVYTSASELSFVRVPVEVDRIEGDEVWLSSGLGAGTRVVTVGATEVYGSELGIAGSH